MMRHTVSSPLLHSKVLPYLDTLPLQVAGYYCAAQLCPACNQCDSEDVTAKRMLFHVRIQRHKRHRDGESNCLITHQHLHSPCLGGGGEGEASMPTDVQEGGMPSDL